MQSFQYMMFNPNDANRIGDDKISKNLNKSGFGNNE